MFFQKTFQQLKKLLLHSFRLNVRLKCQEALLIFYYLLEREDLEKYGRSSIKRINRYLL
jgi:hypothetical protein